MGKKTLTQNMLAADAMQRKTTHGSTFGVMVILGIFLIPFLLLMRQESAHFSASNVPAVLIIIVFVAFFCYISRNDGHKSADVKQAQVAAIQAGNFFLIPNEVTYREEYTEVESGSTDYTLFFHVQSGHFRRNREVDKALFMDTALGDLFYLLYVGDEWISLYPAKHYELDPALSSKLCKDPTLIGKAEWTEKDLESRTKGGFFTEKEKEKWRREHKM